MYSTPLVEVKLDYMFDDIYYVVEELFDDISDDLSDMRAFTIDENHLWLKVTVNGELAGYYWLHPYTNSVFQVHVNILKSYRKYKEEITKVFKEEVIKNIPDYVDHFIATIPSMCTGALKYTLDNGWSDRGYIKDVFLKNGTYYDYNIVGITVEKFKEQANS